jgi:ketosteroid isomerase-like protein
MKLLMLFALLAVACAAAGVEDEVQAVEREWAAAIQSAAGAAKLESLLSSDLAYLHANGVVDDKASYIAKIKSGRQKYTGVTPSNVKIKVFNGDTGVLTARMRMQGTNANGPFDDQVLMTHVWVKTNGRWQLAAHQTTKVQ